MGITGLGEMRFKDNGEAKEQELARELADEVLAQEDAQRSGSHSG